jgi:hypothetical protein
LEEDIAQIAMVENAAKPSAAATTMVMPAQPSASKTEVASRIAPFAAGTSKSKHCEILL